MELLFWVYLSNTVIVIVHEMDSAYWKEWKLINPNKEEGIEWFLIIHIPLLFVVLYGLLLVYNQSFAGLIISLVVALAGIMGFFFHLYHLRKGRPEFNTIVSKSLIIAMLVLSVTQIVLTVKQIL